MTLKALRDELSSLKPAVIQSEKRRAPDEVIRRYNESGYMSPNVLYQVPLYPYAGTNNWSYLQVMAIDDDRFSISSRYNDLVFKDDDLKPNHEGKIVINIEPLLLENIYNIELPQEFELPLEVLEKRREKRRLKSLARNAVFIDYLPDPWRYFYIEDSRLRILQGEKEATADEIEIIHGRKAVKVESLELGHPYLELPEEVAPKFKNALLEKALESLALVPAGVSLLNGCDYYELNMEIPESMFNHVKDYFTWFGDGGEMKGWLTCYPGKVAETLRIPILD